jgi:hypothetical protein
MDKFDLFSIKQFGFMGGRSTTLQLLKVLDHWTTILDNGGTIDTIYTDLIWPILHPPGTVPVLKELLNIVQSGLSIMSVNSYKTLG